MCDYCASMEELLRETRLGEEGMKAATASLLAEGLLERCPETGYFRITNKLVGALET